MLAVTEGLFALWWNCWQFVFVATSLHGRHEATVESDRGATFTTGTTKDTNTIKVEICNKCHPYFTGKQKLVDAGGRVDKFKKRYGLK